MGKMIKRKIAAVLTVLFVLGAFTGCSGNMHVGDLFSDEKNENDYNICIAIKKIQTLNPAVSFDENTINISKLIYSSLFKFNEAMIPETDLAESYLYSADGNTLEINLRSGVTWHDGEKFTASDVKFTIDALKYLASYGETPYASYVANIKSVKVNSDSKVTVTFGKDDAKGLENLTFPILPAHLYSGSSGYTKLRSDIDTFMPIGTGMYKLESYDRVEEIVLTPNEDYYENKAENALTFKMLPELSNGLNLMEVGDVTLILMNEYDRETTIANTNAKITNYPSGINEVIGFNMTGEFTSNKYFRQAIAYLVDNESLIENIYYRNGYLTDSIIGAGYYGLEDSGDKYPYDTEKAVKLLEKAGCIDRDDDGYLENKDNADVELRFLVNESDGLKIAAAGAIKKSIEKHGISVIIDYCSGEEYEGKLSGGDFDMFLGSCSVGERYDLRAILHSQYNNPVNYSNQTVDKLTTEMLSETSEEQKAETVSKLKNLLIEEIPYYPILNKSYGVVSSRYFVGELQPMFNNPFLNCGQWYTDGSIY